MPVPKTRQLEFQQSRTEMRQLAQTGLTAPTAFCQIVFPMKRSWFLGRGRRGGRTAGTECHSALQDFLFFLLSDIA